MAAKNPASDSAWEKIDQPNLEGFYKNKFKNEYFSISKNSTEKQMDIRTQTPEQITHGITFLRRKALEEFGINNWQILEIKKDVISSKKIKVSISGSYTDRNEKKVHFVEHLYFENKNFTQFAYINKNSTPAHTNTSNINLKNLFKRFEAQYLDQ